MKKISWNLKKNVVFEFKIQGRKKNKCKIGSKHILEKKEMVPELKTLGLHIEKKTAYWKSS